jgi:hypothetical protein
MAEKTLQELIELEAKACAEKKLKKAEKIRWQIQAILDAKRRAENPDWSPAGYTGRNSNRR